MNEHTIGVDVFGKPTDFKENKDSTVRVEMHRLRRKLMAFYADEGADHKVRIIITAGNYTPLFEVRPARNGSCEEPLHAEWDGGDAVASPQPNPAKPEGRPRGTRYAVVSTALVTLGLGIAAVISLAGGRRASLPPPVTAPHGDEIHILAGYSGSDWVDAAGQRWQSDRYFEGGIALPGPGELTPPPPERRLFQTMRQARRAGELPEEDGSFGYDIPMKSGTYELRLYFADPMRQSPLLQDEQDAQNIRHFDVAVNGTHLLNRLDVVSESWPSAVAIRAFKDIVPAADGKVHMRFTPNPNQPLVSALELVPSRPGHANPIRITPRQTVLSDSEGNKWGPDNYFIGGRLIVHEIPASAHLSELYSVERYGNFTYAIPVPPGVYSLTLHFAEAMFVPSAPSVICRGPGCRVFDVTCNGTALLQDFDIFAAGGGPFRAVTRTFHGLRPNGQGRLLLSFSSSVDYAEVRAIEVLDETPLAR